MMKSTKKLVRAVRAVSTVLCGIALVQASSAYAQETKQVMHNHEGMAKSDFPFEQQPVKYPNRYWVLPTIGDGSTPQGGTPPALDKQPMLIRSNFDVSTWLTPTYSKPNPPYGEAKFRTFCNYSHHAYDDPIVFPDQPGAAHLHTFLGNTETNAGSTYRSLRTKGDSTCGGGPINRSAYWYPAVLKDNAIGDGKTMVVKPDYALVYYSVAESKTEQITQIPRGLSFVFGFNPSDPTDEMQHNEVRAAGTSYGYHSNGFLGWTCEGINGSNSNSPIPGSPLQPYLRNANGTATLTCPRTVRIGAALAAPTCWDGHNLASPGGRKHVRQYIIEGNTGRRDLCPNGWYHVASFSIVFWFSHTGLNDYKRWYLSSDRMPGMPRFLNGQSMHADWFGAWDYDVMKTWMVHCNGTRIPGEGKPDPHSCNDTQFGDGRKGLPNLGGHRYADQGAARFDPMPSRR